MDQREFMQGMLSRAIFVMAAFGLYAVLAGMGGLYGYIYLDTAGLIAGVLAGGAVGVGVLVGAARGGGALVRIVMADLVGKDDLDACAVFNRYFFSNIAVISIFGVFLYYIHYYYIYSLNYNMSWANFISIIYYIFSAHIIGDVHDVNYENIGSINETDIIILDAFSSAVIIMPVIPFYFFITINNFKSIKNIINRKNIHACSFPLFSVFLIFLNVGAAWLVLRSIFYQFDSLYRGKIDLFYLLYTFDSFIIDVSIIFISFSSIWFFYKRSTLSYQGGVPS